MVFVKTIKRGSKTYKYWAENQRIDGKIKINILRSLTDEEITKVGLGAHVEPIIPLKQQENKLSLHDKESSSLKIEPKLKSNQLDNLEQWIADINSGNLPNTPSMRPKRFIKEVLNPLLKID